MGIKDAIFLKELHMKDETLKAIETNLAPLPIGPYSQAVALGMPQKLVFVSGQVPLDSATGKLADESITLMTRRILTAIKAILIESGSNLENVVRVEIFCTNLKQDFSAINTEYALHFTGQIKPARQTIEVTALPLGSPLEISCIAVIP